MAGPLHLDVEVNLEESPESPPPQPGSPFVLPVPIPVGELAPVWELPDDGTKFGNYFTRSDVLELKNWAIETGLCCRAGPCLPEFSGIYSIFPRAAVGSQIFKACSYSFVGANAGIYCRVCPINKLEQEFVSSTFRRLVVCRES